jgi:hypothetical protein
LNQFIIDLLSSEIEEKLSPEKAQREATFAFFVYQVIRNKIKIEGISQDYKDMYFLAAIEKTYRRSDRAFQRYHFFTTFYKPIDQYRLDEIEKLSVKIPELFHKIDNSISNPLVDKLVSFTRKQLPPFLILFSIIRTKGREVKEILSNKERLWTEVDTVCRQKYEQLSSRMRTLAIRSFIYIFLTKMVFALILEFPVSRFIYGEVNQTSIIINTLFPPILMLLIVSFFRIPGEDNTKRIYNRIIDSIDANDTFEKKVSYMKKAEKPRRPILIFGFTIFYSITFFVTLSLIYEGLTYLNFNLVSQAVFVFFVSIVTFFSYRIKQVVNEYRLEEKDGVLSPIFDFFFMPVLSLGKFFSGELAKLNFFIVIFDFIIEAPFKFLFEIVEEWISFVKKRKEEII